MKVRNVEVGVKFKLRSGGVYEVVAYEGKSSYDTDLWWCDGKDGEAIFTDWAIRDKEQVG